MAARQILCGRSYFLVMMTPLTFPIQALGFSIAALLGMFPFVVKLIEVRECPSYLFTPGLSVICVAVLEGNSL